MKTIERLFELQELELGPGAGTPEAATRAATIRKEIPEPILSHYLRLVARGKKGVALVQNGVCTGCRMRLASGAYAQLLRDDDIAMCDSCARYLMLAAAEPAPPSSPAPVEAPKGRRGRPKGSKNRRRAADSPEPSEPSPDPDVPALAASH